MLTTFDSGHEAINYASTFLYSAELMSKLNHITLLFCPTYISTLFSNYSGYYLT